MYDPDDNPTISVEEMSRRLGGKSESFIYDQVAKGRLKGHKLGSRSLQFSENQYRDYLELTSTESHQCQTDENDQTDRYITRQAIKTKSSVSQELGNVLTRSGKRKPGSGTRRKTQRVFDKETEHDAYSGKH